MARGKKTGGGSRKGRPNHATANAREAIGRLVDDNVWRLQGWLNEVAEKDGPEAARHLLEIAAPRLARTELTDADGKPLNLVLMVPPKASSDGR